MILDKAMQRFSTVVGAEWASVEKTDRRAYVDAYSPDAEGDAMASGFVAPANVEEVQAIVRIANELKTPLWPVSTGRNLAYGGAAPRTNDCVVLDLKRMNRVLEVNDELAYAVVEPGVSFFDLHRYLKDNGHRMWISVPGPGWGSVIGNALERGVGYGRDSDHLATTIGMEVVLPNGDLLRTGNGAMTGNPSWHIMQYGFGPMVDGLFSQSGYGIVTRMGRFLTPEPDGFMATEVSLEHEEDIGDLMTRLRPFKLNRMIDTPMVMGNLLIPAAYRKARSEWYSGPGAIPKDILKKIQKELGLGWWNGFFGLYGPEEQVQSRWKAITEAIKDVRGVKYESRFYNKGEKIHHFRDESLSGTPHLHEFNCLNWEDSGAHIDFTPVVPLTKEHIDNVYKIVYGTLNDWGLDYRGGMYCEDRFFRLVTTLIFDSKDEEQKKRVRGAFSALIKTCAEQGYAEYRTHLNYMDEVAATYEFNNKAMLRFQEQLKNAIDPQGIIAPGKSGIWGAYQNKEDT